MLTLALQPMLAYVRIKIEDMNNDYSNTTSVIGRDKEIRLIMQILARESKNSVLLVGEPGVGKSAIMEGFANKLKTGDVPDILKGYSIKCELPSTSSKDEKIIYFVDEIHKYFDEKQGSSFADSLKPLLARSGILLVGATTADEYKNTIRKDKALDRRFQKVIVEEPNFDDTLSILRGIKNRLENHHNVVILDDALIAAVDLSTRYITDKFLPDKAIDLVDEACASLKLDMATTPDELDQLNRKINLLKMEKASLLRESNASNKVSELSNKIASLQNEYDEQKELWNLNKTNDGKIKSIEQKILDLKKEAAHTDDVNRRGEIELIIIPKLKKDIEELNNLNYQNGMVVDKKNIAKIISTKYKIPMNNILSKDKSKFMNLKDNLGNRVFGQDEAVTLVSNTVKRSMADIQDDTKPLGSFLFLGPTGVGKTELAKALAEQLFETESKLIRFDMSEFSEKHEVARLTGAAPGYIGYREGGQLTEAVRKNPYSILLFDEVEKAHPDIFNVFLQILDDGRLTDSMGNVVNFKNTIIILTSNLGAECCDIQDAQARKNGYLDAVHKFFKPEFINRMDEVVVFNKLDADGVKRVIDKFIGSLSTRLEKQNIKLSVSDAAKGKIAEQGVDLKYGARPINRYIQNEIETKIADIILSDNLPEGVELNIDYSNVISDFVVNIR